MNNEGKQRRRKSFKRILKHKIFRFRNIFVLICFFLAILSCFLFFKLGFISVLFSIVIFVVLFILSFLGFIFINVHRKTWLKVIGYILLILEIIICIVLLYYSTNTRKFFHQNFSTQSHVYSENTYYLIGKNENKSNEVKGIVGVYYKTYNLNGVFQRVSNKYAVEKYTFDDVSNLMNAFSNDEVSYILIDKSLYHIIFSISDFQESDYFIADTFLAYTKKHKSNSTNATQYSIFMRLVSENDLNDFNVIASINHLTHTVLLTYIPESSYLELDNGFDKLEYISLYGTDATRVALEDLLDIDIDYSLTLSAKKLEEVIDSLGGIDFCGTDEFEIGTSADLLEIHNGCNHIDGEDALEISKYEDERLTHNVQIVNGIIDKSFDYKVFKNYHSMLNTFGNMIDTDLPEKLVIKLAHDILYHEEWDIQKQSITGDVSNQNVCFSSLEDEVYLLDDLSIKDASTSIKKVLK